MSNVKRALVVDDDEILRGGMRSILEGLGFMVDEAQNGQDAKNVLMTKDFFIVVSDTEMPEADGLALLEFVQKLGGPRFLLVADRSSPLQLRDVLQMGADGLLAKPFSKADFTRAVDACLSRKDAGEGASLEAEFVRVPLRDIAGEGKLKCDAYLRMSASKFLKIGHRGLDFERARALAYAEKGVHWLHLRKEDFAAFVGFSIDGSQMSAAEKEAESGHRIRKTRQLTEALIAKFAEGGVAREQLEEASTVVLNAVEMLSLSPASLRLLQGLETAAELPSHSLAVALWSCLIARHVGWTGQSTFFRLAVSAFFHDVGERELLEELTMKQRFQLSQDERKQIEAHTFRGRDILLAVPGLPEDAATVALQHHELISGGGFPYGLGATEIHPFARLIGVADRFCELLRSSGDDMPLDLPSQFEKMNLYQRDYDSVFLQGLGDIVMANTDADLDKSHPLARKGAG